MSVFLLARIKQRLLYTYVKFAERGCQIYNKRDQEADQSEKPINKGSNTNSEHTDHS